MDEARFEIRHGTQDQEVFDEVVVKNQYLLADKFPPDSLVIDIGANIGAFAVACLLRGAGAVICFEPSQENFSQLGNNLLAWPEQAVAFNAGVWRSDVEQEISFSPGFGTATGCCFPRELNKDNPQPPRANAIGLDEVILQSTNNGERRVQLLKVDAEYSEYPILYSSKRLDLVDEIIGETHEFASGTSLKEQYYSHPDYKNTATDMARFLQDQGFVVQLKPESLDNQINSLFFASRTPEPK